MNAKTSPPAAPSRIAGVAIALLAAILAYAELLAFGADMGVPSAIAALVQMVLAAAALALLGPGETSAFWRALAAPLAFLALAAGWAALGARLGGPLAPDGAALEIVKLVGIMGMVAVGALIGRRRERLEAFGVALALLGLAYVVLCLALARLDPLKVWGYPKGAHAFRFTGTLINANAAGCAFGMIALVALGAILSLLRRFDLRTAGILSYVRLMGVGAALLGALGACALTASRTSLVGAVVLGVALAAGSIGRRGRPPLALILAGLIGIFAVTWLALAQIGWRWDTLHEDAGQRAMAYEHFLALAGEHPLFGVGLGGFRGLNQATLTPADAPYLWDYGAAHSVLLQAWLEAGWPFALLALLAVASLLTPALCAALAGRLSALANGAMAAAALAGLCSSVDIALNTPSISALAALLLACAFGAAAAPPRRTKARSAASPLAARPHPDGASA